MPEQEIKRRLAAILAADVVGYSRLMGADEAGTLARLKSILKEVVLPEIARSNGRVVKLMGDGVLAEFPSVVGAVQCAVHVQELLKTREPDVENDRRVSLRIGINLGDVIVDGEDIFGDGVNVAARLEGLARPGAICVSESVRTAVGNKIPISFNNLGERSVKNIEDPIRVYEISDRGEKPTESHKQRSSGRPAIAVLPFVNMSGDPEQEYFSDGITEDIIAALSHFRSFPVIARNSTFSYKGQAVRTDQVARELGARYVLEGSIRKSGSRVRITAQLIDAETGHHVWAGRFDRTMDDIFDVQDEITQKIVATVQPELAQAELKKVAVKRPENLTAWDLVMRGMALVNRHTTADHEPARGFFQAAIDLDPDYADAWSGIAWSYLANIALVGADEREALLEKGLRAAKHAIKLDDRSAFAHYVLGVGYVWDEQFQKGISEVEISLQLNPYSAQAHMGLGNRLDLVGRTEEGIAKMEQALQLSPRDPFCPTVMSYLARAYLSLNEPDRALQWIEQAVSLKPDNPDLQYRYAVCLSHLDRIEESKKALQECERLQPGFLEKRKTWRPYSDDERNDRFFAGMFRHGLVDPR